jgi:hypothetical protein
VSVKHIPVNFITKSCQDCKFVATKLLQKETLNGLELKIPATVALFLLTIFYKLGYCSFKAEAPAMYPPKI